MVLLFRQGNTESGQGGGWVLVVLLLLGADWWYGVKK